MRDTKYWEDASVNCMLMTERSVTAYEKDLESLYAVLSSNIEKEITFIYDKFGKNNKILYSDLRRRIDDTLFKKFKNQLKSILNKYDVNIVTKDFINLTKQLYNRKTITALEYIQYMCQYHIIELSVSNMKYTEQLYDDIYVSSYSVHFYNYVNGVQKDIEFVPVKSDNIKNALIGKWGNSTNIDRIKYGGQQLSDTITQLIPQCIARGFSAQSTFESVDKALWKRYNYDRANARTNGDFINNEAHKTVLDNVEIEQYVYVAVLDSVTTPECRSLDGSVFNLSQAKVGVNFPPLHHNCRSSVAPMITPQIVKKLQNLDDISRKNILNDWLKRNLPESQQYILTYIGKYY